MTETLSTKRHSEIVFVCAACDMLGSSSRKHATTCSARCRTWLHRHPVHAAKLEVACAALNVPVALQLQTDAVQRLRPDLVQRIISGEIEIEATREDVYREFIARLFAAAESAP